MKHLKLFEAYMALMTLYHGTPYEFDDFKQRMTFFSKTPTFARRYADTKSQDFQLDAQTRLLECEVEGNFFDIFNEADYKRLEAVMPDQVKVNYMYQSAMVDKEELLRNLKGELTIKPKRDLLDNIHKLYDTTHFNGENVICLDFQPTSIKVYSYRSWEEYVSAAMTGSHTRGKNYNHLPAFKSYREASIAALKEHDPSENWAYIAVSSRSKLIDMTMYEFEKGRELIKNMIPAAKEELRQAILADVDCDQYFTEPTVEPLESNWIFFENETVIQLVAELGYDGYVATEGDVTYAIFDPTKSVKRCKTKTDY